MYSVTPSFIAPHEEPPGHKAWLADASDRGHGQELQRVLAALEELMFLVRLHEQDDARAQRELLRADDRDAAAFRDDKLVVPFVAVHRGVAALAQDQLVHRGLARAVLAADQLPHLHVVAAVFQETHGPDRPNGRRVHGARTESARPNKRLRRAPTLTPRRRRPSRGPCGRPPLSTCRSAGRGSARAPSRRTTG